MILVYLIPISVVYGYIRGGTLRAYADAPLRCIALPALAFLVEALMVHLPEWTGLENRTCLMLAVPLEYALLAAFCLLNFRRRGAKWLLCGVALNFLVIAVNGLRMPVSDAALVIESTRATAECIASGELFEYVLVNSSAPLYCLGDIIYLPFLPGALGSAGDFVLGIGVFRMIVGIMKQKPARK